MINYDIEESEGKERRKRGVSGINGSRGGAVLICVQGSKTGQSKIYGLDFG